MRRSAAVLAVGLVVLVSVYAASVAGDAAPTVLRPIDQAADCGFTAFREPLRTSIADRDASALLAAVDLNIRISFGDVNGREAFERHWKPADASSEVWKELDRILALGGTCQGDDNFVAPYVYAAWPEDVDSFTHAAITGRGVRLRAEADARGRLITSLDYAIVRIADPASRRTPWTAVTTPRGRGFVASEFVRSPIDYRAFFHRRGATWTLTALLAGD